MDGKGFIYLRQCEGWRRPKIRLISVDGWLLSAPAAEIGTGNHSGAITTLWASIRAILGRGGRWGRLVPYIYLGRTDSIDNEYHMVFGGEDVIWCNANNKRSRMVP